MLFSFKRPRFKACLFKIEFSHAHNLRVNRTIRVSSLPTRTPDLDACCSHRPRQKKGRRLFFLRAIRPSRARFSLRVVVVVVLRLSQSPQIAKRARQATIKRRRRERERDKKEFLDFRVSNMCISLGFLYLSLFSLLFFLFFLLSSHGKNYYWSGVKNEISTRKTQKVNYLCHIDVSLLSSSAFGP